MTTGLTIITERGTIEVPRAVEAEGGDAVAAFVDAHLGASATTPTPAPAPAAQAPALTPTPEE